MQWEPVIGLEIHVQLATRSKIFSGASTAYGAEPNTHACVVDLGFPGVLPVLNGEAVRMAIRFGLAIGAEVARRSVFARKNYFYPDLPKGYQISQYELPVVGRGEVAIDLDDRETFDDRQLIEQVFNGRERLESGDAGNREIYEGLYREVYRKMYRRLRPLYRQIRRITGYPSW